MEPSILGCLAEILLALAAAISTVTLCKNAAKKKKSDEPITPIIYANMPLSSQPRRALVEAASPLDLTQRSKLGESPMHFPPNKSPSDPLRPRKFLKTEKERRIKEEGLKRKKSDYPTIEDILSDWSSEREDKKSPNEASPAQTAGDANNRST